MMLRGFNPVAGIMNNLYLRPVYRDALAWYLQQLPVDQKVMRFPDGMESIVERRPFDFSLVHSTLQFYAEAGVKKIVFRIDPYQVSASLDAYLQIKSSNIVDILYLEVGNEPFMSPLDDPKTTREWWQSKLFKQDFYKAKANDYADDVLFTRDVFEKNGVSEPDKWAIAMPINLYGKGKTWRSVLQDRLPAQDFPVAAVHPYNSNPYDAYWLQNMGAEIFSIKDKNYRLIATEFNAIHFGKDGGSYSNLAFTPFHRDAHRNLVNFMKSYDFELGLLHSLFSFDSDRMFPRYTASDNSAVVVDRMAGWD